MILHPEAPPAKCNDFCAKEERPPRDFCSPDEAVLTLTYVNPGILESARFLSQYHYNRVPVLVLVRDMTCYCPALSIASDGMILPFFQLVARVLCSII